MDSELVSVLFEFILREIKYMYKFCITFQSLIFGRRSLMRVQYPECAYGPYC